ncbi:hypothetical protein ACFQ88_16750 [Paenibacillus sp. NPDC056579]|uniref:hypothetical protein n=1 Tax=Paenibacillus sp. NPDC056579 TaxID=3345871 RepID=UPI0036C446DA
MGKLFRGIVTLCVCCALLLALGYWYAQPERPLDLAYSELQIRSKLADMLTSRKLEVQLTEAEVNSLLKKSLAARSQINPDLQITGAQFSLEGNQWIADVNVLYKHQWTFGARMYFAMSWREPYMTAEHTATQIKQITVPASWFQLEPLQIELNDYVPKPAGVRGVAFEEHGVRVGLKLR